MANIGNTDDVKDNPLIVISFRSFLLAGTIVVAVSMAMSAVVAVWVAGWFNKCAVPQTPAAAQVAVQPASPPHGMQAASVPGASAALVSPAPQGQVLSSVPPASVAPASNGWVTADQHAGSASNITLCVTASSPTIRLGESFTLKIEVEGADRGIATPDLSAMQQADVQFLSQHSNSRSSISVFNGRMTRQSFEGRVFSYKITPKVPGPWFSGPLRVTAAGRTCTHPGVTIQVTKVPAS